MLESKAKYYEELMKGNRAPEAGDEELFLVDFEKKIHENLDEEESADADQAASSSGNKYSAIAFNYEDVSDKKFNSDSQISYLF